MKALQTILVVDDDEVDRRAVARMLRDGDDVDRYTLSEAADGRTGLEIAGRQAIACALLDYRLPDLDGPSWLEHINALAAPPPVIVLTGLDDRRAAVDSLQGGAQDYLVKGQFGTDALKRAIRYAIERHRVTAELREARREVERLAFLDPLTGVLNRRGLEHMLPGDLNRASRSGERLYAVLVDCDDFKAVNERWGHAAGDLALVEIVRRTLSAVRASDHFARVGGDEFILLVPDGGARLAMALADRIRCAISDTPFILNGQAARVSVSQGVFVIPETVRSVTDLFASGQLALRRSKGAGKNTVTLADLPNDGVPLHRSLSCSRSGRVTR